MYLLSQLVDRHTLTIAVALNDLQEVRKGYHTNFGPKDAFRVDREHLCFTLLYGKNFRLNVWLLLPRIS